MLARLTGADVAASEDLTGAGGDWDLERQTGAIEARNMRCARMERIAGAFVHLGVIGAGRDRHRRVGTTAVWENAGTLGGTSIDLRATVTSLTTLGGLPFFGTLGDDAFFQLTQQGNATLRWEIFASGTNQTVYAVGSPEFRIADIDGIGGVVNTRESTSPQLNGLTSYTVSNPTNLVVSVSAGGLQASGTQDQNGESTSLVGYVWSNVSSWDVTYNLHINDPFIQARFLHDGDGDFTFVSPVTTSLLSLDLDGNNSTAAGTAIRQPIPRTALRSGRRRRQSDCSACRARHRPRPGDACAHQRAARRRLDRRRFAGGDRLEYRHQCPWADHGHADGRSHGCGLSSRTRRRPILQHDTAGNMADRTISVSVTNTTFSTTSLEAISTIHVVNPRRMRSTRA